MTIAVAGVSEDAWQLLDALGQAALVVDAGFVITHWNRAAEQLYGWPASEAKGRDARELFIPAGLEQDTTRIAAQLLRGQSWTGALTVAHKNGGWVRVVITDTPVVGATGGVTGVVMLAASLNATAGPLLDHSHEAAVVLDSDGLVLFASRAVIRLYGWCPDELIGQRILTLVHPDDHPVARGLARASAGNTEQHCWELRVRGQGQDWLWVQASVTNLLREPGVRGLLVYLHDVTARRAARAQLLHAHQHDPLTGLPNRAALLSAIENFTPAADTKGLAGALLVLSVTSAGGRWSRSVADEAYRVTARRLRAEVSDIDLCGSISEGEFALLVPHLSNRGAALMLAEQIQMELSVPITAEATSVLPMITVGLTMVAGRRRAHELLAEATIALQQAHGAGPGRVRAFGATATAAAGLTAGATGSDGDEGQPLRLSQALTAGELEVYYQPVVTLADGAVTGVEALLRWEHPTRGLLDAGAFLHLAEGNDLINDLGAFVLNRACPQVVAWDSSTLELSINVSTRQLADPHLAREITRAMDQAGLDPTRLILEITETALLRDLNLARATLTRCRARGIRISIDDFGTGFAGYGYLRELPVDEIKIDRSFTSGLLTDAISAAIVGGIIHLARSLGMSTTAEGIETAQQAALLSELGCDKGQGFLWSPAQPGHQPPTLPVLPAPRSAVPTQPRAAPAVHESADRSVAGRQVEVGCNPDSPQV